MDVKAAHLQGHVLAGPDVYGPPYLPRARTRTHEVLNQAPPIGDINPATTYPALVELLHAYGAGWAQPRLEAFGRVAGSSRL